MNSENIWNGSLVTNAVLISIRMLTFIDFCICSVLLTELNWSQLSAPYFYDMGRHISFYYNNRMECETGQTTCVLAKPVTWQCEQTTWHTWLKNRTAWQSKLCLHVDDSYQTAWLGYWRNERCDVSRNKHNVCWYSVADTGSFVLGFVWVVLAMSSIIFHSYLTVCFSSLPLSSSSSPSV